MKILVINCGSSSLKYQLIDMENESVLCKGLCERIGINGSKITHKANGQAWTEETPFPTHTEAFAKLVDMMTTGEGAVVADKSEIGAIGHRVVQGAEFFTESCLVDDSVIDKIEEIAPLAPVHNMAHVQGLRSAKAVFGAHVPNVVVFDTTFHQTMPPKAYIYGVNYEMYEKYSIRRYGAHGTSHRYVSKAAAEYLQKDPSELKMVTCHLGNGSSITAVDGGKSIDTSMGLTPLAGVLMGTRCGDIDPSVVTYMEQKLGIHGQEMADYLNKTSGLLGISGISSDKRDVEEAAAAGHERAKLAEDMLNYQIKKYIGSYTAAMGGLDCLVFTGGIGENDHNLRAGVCENMEFFGIKLDLEKNKQRGADIIDLTAEGGKVKILLVCTNEELMIARDTLALVQD
ncbi:MAG: acetate kinase [Candidatus Fournierella pullistercoris]|uniref:Acetate kinase n=1 Tax=Candidatus Allofournierella pullistercoris TaxID=2838597 RepID=A0A948T085_9FIRM|nr:acetate kinase [Candidatus Fournierella pullistercoris]